VITAGAAVAVVVATLDTFGLPLSVATLGATAREGGAGRFRTKKIATPVRTSVPAINQRSFDMGLKSQFTDLCDLHARFPNDPTEAAQELRSCSINLDA
jgi:hypothetical protein